MPPTEDDELLGELVGRWTETHKKSMLLVVVLVGLLDGPMWAKQVEGWIGDATGWTVSERGLHRVLQKLAATGLVDFRREKTAGPGADRKVYALTELGRRAVVEMRDGVMAYASDPEFTARIQRA